MYAILNDENIVVYIETRELPLSELVHPNFEHLYIRIDESDDIKLGDIYNWETNCFEQGETIVDDEVAEDIEEIETTQADRIEANTDFIVMMLGV